MSSYKARQAELASKETRGEYRFPIRQKGLGPGPSTKVEGAFGNKRRNKKHRNLV